MNKMAARRPPPPLPNRLQVCRNYLWGTCTKGLNCRFRHEENLMFLMAPPPPPPPPAQMTPAVPVIHQPPPPPPPPTVSTTPVAQTPAVFTSTALQGTSMTFPMSQPPPSQVLLPPLCVTEQEFAVKMSSQHQYMSANSASTGSRVGDIEHISHLSEHIGSLCLSSEYSDVTLIVEGQRIPAHKVILAASSDYFRALLYGGMREATQAEVELQAPLQAFKALLRYVYSGHMGLSLLREDTVLDILGLAHQFNFQELEAAISDHLGQVLALRNVCSVLDAARCVTEQEFAVKMSSQHQYMSANSASTGSRVGDIEHISHLSEHIGSLCLSSEYSDVTLIVEGQRIPAHKVILAASSDYFRALLYGGMREATQAEVELQAPLQAFKALLRYVYSGHMGLSLLREDTVLDILGLAHQFNFQELEAAISDHLGQVLALRNVCSVLDAARLYGLEVLRDYCYNFLGRNAAEVLQHEIFLQLSVEDLQGLLERDSFFAPEVDIFKAVCNWLTAKAPQGKQQAKKILKCVRLTLISFEELIMAVRPFSLVSPYMLLDAILEKSAASSTDLPHRGLLVPEENVATPKHGARVTSGDIWSALLDGDTDNYDIERGYTPHTNSDAADNPGIVVRLANPTIINHIRLLLWDRDYRTYTYFIEVSVDQKDWVRVVDHSNYFCRSWQNLYFEARVVQYIKLVGINMVFHAVALEAMHTRKVPPLSEGLVKPVHNVATVELSAIVLAGISRSRNALLNGDTEHYDREQGYTSSQLGSGTIVLQLAQPYLLSSIRLLWDSDYPHHSYFVQTSCDFWHWKIVAQRTRDKCRSWQVIYFSPRPVCIIRIVGINNSVNEVFHLLRLECPAQVDEAADPAAKKQRPSPDNRLNPAPGSPEGRASPPARSASPPARSASLAPSDAGSAGSDPPRSLPPLPPAETATEAAERYD